MTSDNRKKIESEIMTALWLDLKDHGERNAIFLVNQDLDLALVGEKVMTDEASTVAAWINDGSLTRPTPQQMATWASESGKTFRFIILAPHILIQEQSH